MFISFAPSGLVGRISSGEKPEYGRVQKLATNRVGRQRFADVRELHGTLMTKWLRESEIDFLHGRANSSVFMRDYFNPAWIGDLEERASRGGRRCS